MFIDKNDHKTKYKNGTILEISDETRVKDLIDRNLCKNYSGNKEADITLIQ